MGIELTTKISDLMARRRKRYNIPNNNCTIGNHNEIIKIEKYIIDGYSNSQILEKNRKGKI